MTLQQVLVAVAAVVAATLAWYLYNLSTYWKRHGVPHNKSYPLVGNNIQILLRQRTLPELALMGYQGFAGCRYFGAMDFLAPVLQLRDPELIKEITVKSFEHFPDHKGFTDETVDPILGKNVFSLRGEKWRHMRTALSPSFTASKMKFLFQLVSKCAEDFVGYFEKNPDTWKSLNVKEAFTRYTNDVIATSAFGISVNSMKERDNEFYRRGQEISDFGSFRRIIKFILARNFPGLLRLLRVQLFSPESTNFFKSIVSETLETRDKQGIVRPDMIHMLMQARDKANLSVDDITAQAFIFFLAGFETTALFMCFMAHELAVNPDIQERLYKEIDRCTADGSVSYDDLHKMEYMDMVCSEALRKYPLVVVVDRLCAKDFPLPKAADGYSEYVVPKGTLVWIPVYALHHDPQYFPNPQKFDPERFNAENKEKINPYTYLPFGIGPRKCIGNRFALMEAKILMANLLRKFRFERAEKTVEPLVFSRKNLSMNPAGGFWIRLEPRAT